MTGDPAEFTERSYRAMLEELSAQYRFEPYGTECTSAHVLWRHDVDLSVHRAVALAAIEVDVGVRATYFFLLSSDFYNLFEQAVLERARRVIALGHGLGLHFDVGVHPEGSDIEATVRREAAVLGEVFDAPVEAVSFHNPVANGILDRDDEVVGGLLSAYARTLRDRYRYVSDSNGYWRFESVRELAAEGCPRLHVLTHPGWWTPEPAPPRQRIDRCIAGRAEATGRSYDELMARTSSADGR